MALVLWSRIIRRKGRLTGVSAWQACLMVNSPARQIPFSRVLLSGSLLANIYLHHVFDQWAHQWRRRKARGEVHIVRYADDIVMCFQHEGEARAFRREVQGRLADFGLQLHPDKTRVIRFGRFARKDSHRDGRWWPETFDFLGYTHY